MKKTFFIPLIMFAFVFAAAGQKLVKPTKMSSPATAVQEKIIQEGIKLHDSKDYDGAIAKYQQVLTENPDCTVAMYEMALSYYTKGDKVKAMETAYRGSAYISDDLALFYGTMANCLDDVGKPDEAVRVYREAENILQGYPDLKRHLASVYYNLGVTYSRQQKYPEAKAELKKAIQTNYSYASPHLLLANIYYNTRYKIPALLAASRFISLEFDSERTKRAARMIDQITSGSTQKGADGKITINLDFLAPSDEGDFGVAELLFAITDTEVQTKDKEKAKMTPEERFADRIESLIAFLDPKDKKNKDTFVGKSYFPFMNEMKAKGYVKPFAYLILYSNGNQNAVKWVTDNRDAMIEMINWAKDYQLPAK